MLRFYHASKESVTPRLVFSRLQFHQTSGSIQPDPQVSSVSGSWLAEKISRQHRRLCLVFRPTRTLLAREIVQPQLVLSHATSTVISDAHRSICLVLLLSISVFRGHHIYPLQYRVYLQLSNPISSSSPRRCSTAQSTFSMAYLI